MSTAKRIFASIGIVVLCIFLVLGMLIIAARSARVQTAAASVVAEQMTRALGARVEVGTLDFKFPNRLLVRRILIEDQQQDTMLFVDTLSARADIIKLLREDTLCIRQVTLAGGFTDIHRLPDSVGNLGPLNCQFIFDAFASDSQHEQKPLGINLQVQDIALREVYLNYCGWSAYLPTLRSHLRDISASTIDAEIEQLTLFAEHNGYDLDIDNLEARVVLTDTLITFPKLRVRMPHSDFHVEQLTLDRAEVKRLADASRLDSTARQNAWARTGIALNIENATITPADLSALVPALHGMRAPWALSAAVSGRIDSLEATALSLNYDGRPILRGNVTALGLPLTDSLWLRAQVSDISVNRATLQDIISGATGKPVQLPDMLARLGQVHYRGALEGRLADLTLRGAFTSALGSIRTDGHAALPADFSAIDFRGLVSTRRFELGRLLGQTDMGNIALTVQVDGNAANDRPFTGHVCANIDNFTFRQYAYRDIHIDGYLTPQYFDGLITSDDPNLAFRFLGIVDFKKADPIYAFALRLRHFRPGPLHLSDKYADADLALNLDVEIEGSNLDNLSGNITLDSVSFSHAGRSFFIRDFDIIAENNQSLPSLKEGAGDKSLSISSNYINARLWGQFSYATIATSVLRCVARYVPHAFSAERERQLKAAHPSNDLEFYIYANHLNELCDVLELPVSPHDMSTIKGSLSDHDGSIVLQAYLPELYAANQHLEHLTLDFNNADDRLNLALAGLRHHGDAPAARHMGDFRYHLSAHAKTDTIGLSVDWLNPDTVHNGGLISISTALGRYAGLPLIDVHMLPSEFVLADSIWHLDDSRITYSAADTVIQVNHFRLWSSDQSIYANGIVSRQEQDSIYANLQNVDLDYFLGALTDVHQTISFGGRVTGWATGYGLLRQPMFEANVSMLDAKINGYLLGDVFASATLDREAGLVLINGDAYDRRLADNLSDAAYDRRLADNLSEAAFDRRLADNSAAAVNADSTIQTIAPTQLSPEGRHVVHVDGTVGGGPGAWGLDIYPDSVELGFVNYWVGSFLSDLRGRGSGYVRIRGGKNGDLPYTSVTLRALAHDASFTLPFTGARYFLNDSIIMDSTAIVFGSTEVPLRLHDAEGNRVDLSGAVRHNGEFRDIIIDLTAKPYHAIVLDLPEADNDFYGRVYADGTATVRGNEQEIHVAADATTAPRSRFTLSLSNASNASNTSFVEFIDHSKNTLAPVGERDWVRGPSDTKVYLDLRMAVTPQAQVSVLLDRHTGDCLTGRGEGDIRFRYADFENTMQMLGTYTLQSGTFGFTFQNVIRKEFQIAEGSSVTWNGSPEEPIVDVRAVYRTTASLRDLFGTDASSVTSRSNVPVHCILYLTERLSNPLLRFGIELPQSDESVASQVQSVINTEEMLMRQVLYLLVFNRFYTPDYLRDASMTGINETYSLISSTVTGQINNWLGKLTDKFSVGFNVRADASSSADGSPEGSQEYEAQFEIQPVTGLLINGNVGYRYNDISNQPVFGNLDIEYMLTPDGKLRAKAYTHTVDKYSLRQANTIQGVGFIFKHDFNLPSQQEQALRAARRQAKKDERTAIKEQRAAQKEQRTK